MTPDPFLLTEWTAVSSPSIGSSVSQSTLYSRCPKMQSSSWRGQSTMPECRLLYDDGSWSTLFSGLRRNLLPEGLSHAENLKKLWRSGLAAWWKPSNGLPPKKTVEDVKAVLVRHDPIRVSKWCGRAPTKLLILDSVYEPMACEIVSRSTEVFLDPIVVLDDIARYFFEDAPQNTISGGMARLILMALKANDSWCIIDAVV